MLSAKEKRIVIDCVNQNLNKKISVREVSELLINHGSKEERFSTGKPKIFVDVVTFLNDFECTSKEIEEDRTDVYFVFEKEITKEPQQTEKDEISIKESEGQMSLF